MEWERIISDGDKDAYLHDSVLPAVLLMSQHLDDVKLFSAAFVFTSDLDIGYKLEQIQVFIRGSQKSDFSRVITDVAFFDRELSIKTCFKLSAFAIAAFGHALVVDVGLVEVRLSEYLIAFGSLHEIDRERFADVSSNKV